MTAIETFHTKLAGEFQYQIHNGGKLRETGKIDNLLLDAMFVGWLGGGVPTAIYFSFCGLGTSTSPVVAGDTSITPTADSRVASVDNEPIQVISSNSWKSGKSFVFPVRTTSQTVNKLGIYSAATAGTLSAAALLSSPLNLVAGDILTVKHYVTATVDLSDRTGIMMLDGNNYPYTLRWFNPTGPYNHPAGPQGSIWNINNVGLSATTMGYIPQWTVKQSQTLPTNPLVMENFPSTAGDIVSNITITADAYAGGGVFYRDIEFKAGYLACNTPAGIGNLIFIFQSIYWTVGFFFNFNSVRVPKNNTNELKIKLRFTWGR